MWNKVKVTRYLCCKNSKKNRLLCTEQSSFSKKMVQLFIVWIIELKTEGVPTPRFYLRAPHFDHWCAWFFTTKPRRKISPIDTLAPPITGDFLKFLGGKVESELLPSSSMFGYSWRPCSCSIVFHFQYSMLILDIAILGTFVISYCFYWLKCFYFLYCSLCQQLLLNL